MDFVFFLPKGRSGGEELRFGVLIGVLQRIY